MHKPHSLPIKVILALHREQSMDPIRSLLLQTRPAINPKQKTHQHQYRECSHGSSNSSLDFKWVFLTDLNFIDYVPNLTSQKLKKKKKKLLFLPHVSMQEEWVVMTSEWWLAGVIK
jgi:hypothetical protein